MLDLAEAISDVDYLLALEPEELGAKLLFLLRTSQTSKTFHLGSIIGELWGSLSQESLYPRTHQEEVDLALTEAWAWLEAQGLLVPAEDISNSRGWRQLSRRAKKFEDETDFAKYAVARTLPKDVLHPKIAKKVWMAFMRGEFDVAVFQAMKAVEVAVRAASNISQLGVKLMRSAFNPETGPLTDMTVESGERTARMELFAGAIGSYKNPHSHRDVPLDNPSEALEVILLANHLLRIVESRCQARPS